MKTQSMVGYRRVPGTDRERLQEIWMFLMGMGIALMVLGLAAIGSSLIAPLATVLVFGLVLLLAAIFQVVTALWGRSWRGFFLHLLTGLLYLVAGVFLVDNRVGAALSLTFLVALCLLVGGAARIVLPVMERFEGWAWVCVNGIVSVLLGVAIWRQWPLSGLWVIGLCVGIEMLFSGLSWLMLALAVRRGARAEGPGAREEPCPSPLALAPRHLPVSPRPWKGRH